MDLLMYELGTQDVAAVGETARDGGEAQGGERVAGLRLVAPKLHAALPPPLPAAALGHYDAGVAPATE